MRGAVGVSSVFPGRGSRSRLIVMIQKPLTDDAIRRPSKMDRPALPGPQHRDPGSLDRCKSLGRARRRHPLADDNSPGPGPGIEPGRVGGLAAVVGRADRTNTCE